MFVILLLKGLIVFPFIVYGALRLLGYSNKHSRRLCFILYLISLVLIVNFIFPGLIGGIISVTILGLLAYLTVNRIKSRKKTVTANRFIKAYIQSLGMYYPFIYIGLMVFGIVREFILR